MTRLGYQIPNFTYPAVGPDTLFETVARQVEAAEASGFDSVFLMDHFYQLPGLGTPDQYMLECYTPLAALAGRTRRVRLSALVTGNTYRNPALLAKIITTLDIVSGGRAMLGIGAGWLLGKAIAGGAGIYLNQRFGLPVGVFSTSREELGAFATVAVMGILAGIIPAWQAYRTDVAHDLAEL